MGVQLLVLVAMLVVIVGGIVGASYVFAITAEREPDVNPEVRRTSSVH